VSESNEKETTSPSDNGIRARRRLGGPSTPEGKAKTKFNAITHGIFSNVVVLNGETRADYESLLSGLWTDCQPQGRLEEILVEKLAMILWRHRRLLVSEVGEISKSRHCLIWEKDGPLQGTVAGKGFSLKPKEETQNEPGIFWGVSDLRTLDQCIELFTQLRDGIQTEGFRPEYDEPILNALYGSTKRAGGTNSLAYDYAMWLEKFQEADDPTLRKRGPSAESCQESMCREIDREIERLKQIREQHRAIDIKRRNLEIQRLRIPEGPKLERLLRYEASLERAFDRTMAQLERMQRIRTGQPVPPRLEVGLT
jgi:hypothetical protein